MNCIKVSIYSILDISLSIHTYCNGSSVYNLGIHISSHLKPKLHCSSIAVKAFQSSMVFICTSSVAILCHAIVIYIK